MKRTPEEFLVYLRDHCTFDDALSRFSFHSIGRAGSYTDVGMVCISHVSDDQATPATKDPGYYLTTFLPGQQSRTDVEHLEDHFVDPLIPTLDECALWELEQGYSYPILKHLKREVV